MNLFLFYSLFSVIHDIAHPDPPFTLCDTANFEANTTYGTNLGLLLSSLSSNSSVSKFFNTSVGRDSSKIYGLFLCYLYATDDECRQCMKKVLQVTQKLCMYKYDSVVWDENCFFRYSTEDFFGQLNVTGNKLLDNTKNVTEPEEYKSIVNETLYNLTNLAAFDPSYDMHSSGVKEFMENSPLFAFVQCSKDLSPNDCYTCLETACIEIQDCCYFSRGARVLSRGCFLRYELYDFVNGASEFSGLELIPNDVKPKARNQNKKQIIAGVSIGSGILAISTFGFCVYYLVTINQNQQRQNMTASDQEMQMQETTNQHSLEFPIQDHGKLDPLECPFIEMNIIEEATDNFSDLNKLGEGGFGPVFKGVLPDGQEIAVKKLSSNSVQGSKEFVNEVLLIHKLQHKNLVRLLGFCVAEEEKLLIYEFMPNGSVDVFLWESRKRAQLDWSTRLNIINGVARGMLYLHHDSRLKIIHRDLKPNNVLLDAHMNPKISDFGMAKLFRGCDGEANTARIVGTYGYMAPEFAMEGLYSIKSDVFSFGVLLLEIITGRRNAGFHLTRLAPSLVAYAWQLWNEDRGIELMDPFLADSCSEKEFLRCICIGLLCVQEDAHDRPSMPSVVVMLNPETTTLCQPKPPAFTVGNLTEETCFNNLSVNGLTISDLLPR